MTNQSKQLTDYYNAYNEWLEDRHFVTYKTGSKFSEYEGTLNYIGFCNIFVQMELCLKSSKMETSLNDIW